MLALAVQGLTGLASACSLFLAASGLSLIFGVTRIVNFAHGAFVMLGAYLAYTLTERLAGPLGFWAGIVLAALAIGALGGVFEMVLLRRLYRAPELLQLLATFAATLVVEDLVILLFGPEDRLARRAPGLAGAVALGAKRIPQYDLFLIGVAPVVLAGLWLLLNRTRWGLLVRAATQDREMVAALGVDQRWLFTSVFALGTFLAGLAGALQAPRGAVDHGMDLRIVVDVFVVVVIGGLGSIGGAFAAALLVALLDAYAILVLPKVSIVLVFVVMAGVLVLRPHGLFGRGEGKVRAAGPAMPMLWRPWRSPAAASAAVLLPAALLPLFAGGYGLALASETAIFVLFAASVHLLLGGGGLISFGQAAYFGAGAYGAALAVKALALPMLPALAAGALLGAGAAAAVGSVAVSLSGVSFAMLTLAAAQILWSAATQFGDVTGGDNGLLGVWPDPWAARPATFYLLTLVCAAAGVGLLRGVLFAPFGYALRAVRDSETRAAALGIDRRWAQRGAFTLAGGAAGLAGALYVFLKGSVFPDVLSIPVSVDGLAMVLLGGVGNVSGPIVGAIAYKLLSLWLLSRTDYSKLVLGAVIILLILAIPEGLVAALPAARRLVAGRR